MTLGDLDYYERFPRVSGDEPENVECLACLLPFSPRERG